ncbi:MAG TPA: hypothetical protein VHB70_00375 [Parafilimonas sp.]|nr:hypothetical protein [Parafilimonas sp.]
MTAFKNQDEAVSNVIELYRGKDYSEPVLTALKELLVKKINESLHYDELAVYFDARLQAHGVHYDTANVYLLMMNALLSFSEYCNE